LGKGLGDGIRGFKSAMAEKPADESSQASQEEGLPLRTEN